MLTKTEHGAVLEICMARPPVNAMNPELMDAVTEAVKGATSNYRALVISGREGLFSAGLDVVHLMQQDRQGVTDTWVSFFAMLEAVARSPIPVAAAITGHAPAGGAVLGLFCDYRVMSRGSFKMGLNETRVGLVIPEIIVQRLIRLIGAHQAERMIVAGAMVTPEQALQIELVDDLSDSPAETIQTSVNWCKSLLELPAHAMLGNRQLMRKNGLQDFVSLQEKEIPQFVDGWFEESTQATLKAVLEQLKSRA